MKRILIAGALALGLIIPASADTALDAGGTTLQGVVDGSRTAHAATQCVLTVTATATSLASLWATAGCATLPNQPQFAYVMPTGGAVFYRTDGVTPTTANGWQIFQNQAWPVEERLSIAGMQLISGGSVLTSVEIRY